VSSWKRNRRFIKETFRFWLSSTIRAQDVQKALDLLTPFSTGIPLVRIGGTGDGGYLVPNDLQGIVACFSPGVDQTMTFDTEIMNRGIPCYLADASVTGLTAHHANATFDRLFLGPKTQNEFISLDDWVARYAPPEGDLLLQMDIEGAEYETLNAVSTETLSRFRIIVLEVHDIDKLTRTEQNRKMSETFQRLNDLFVLTHVHPNNYSPVARIGRWAIPPLLELTYIRRDRVDEISAAGPLPHPLDHANVPDKPDYPLPRYWTQTIR
jgi:hypothetical protein